MSRKYKNTHKLTFEFVEEEDGVFWVGCREMDHSSYTKDPQLRVSELLKEWFDADMGTEFLPLGN